MMQSFIKKLGLLNNIAFISLLILTTYLSYKILSQVISHDDSKMELILFIIFSVYIIFTMITLTLINQAFIKKRKGLKLYQNLYALLLFLFLLYLDYFMLIDIRFVMDYLYLLENQIIFVLEVLFNVLTMLVVVLTICLDFAKIDNQ